MFYFILFLKKLTEGELLGLLETLCSRKSQVNSDNDEDKIQQQGTEEATRKNKIEKNDK